MSILHKIGSVIAAGLLAVSSWLSPVQTQQPTQSLGADATNPIAGTNYYLAGSGVSASASSITLTSLTIPQTGHLVLDSELSDTFYITLEPGSRTRQEVASCTTAVQNAAGTATLSGCSRGLLPFTPFTASSTYQFPHAGGTAVVFSNPPQLYSEFTAKGNAAYITGVYTFASSALPRTSSTPTYTTGDELKFVTYGQLASTSFSGTVNASQSQKGIVQIGGVTTTASGATTGSTGAILVPPGSLFNATSSATTTVPVTRGSGKLSQGFLDLTEGFTFSGGVTSTATSTFTGPFVITASSTQIASTTFTTLPHAATSTPTDAGHLITKNYLDSALPNFITESSMATSTTNSTSYIDILSVSFTLTKAQRVTVTSYGTMTNGTSASGAALAVKVDAGGDTDVAAIYSATGGNGYGAGFTIVTSQLSTGAHTIKIRGKAITSGTANFSGLIVQFVGLGQ